MASLYSPTRPSMAYRSPIRTGTYTNYRDRSMNDDASTVHAEYPPTRPFINTDYTRSPTKPVSALPENDRQGVMGALKSLQDKIRKLELERSMAEGNLKNLASETSRYRDMLQREQITQETATATAVSRQSQELESQLTAAESRCNLLEKQLEYMRKMVQNAEKDKEMAVHRHTILDRRKEEDLQAGLQSQLDKIAELEREHLRLTATQSLAENKIRTLEERLQEEQHQRKLIQERAVELQTAAETNRILLEAVSPPHSRPSGGHKPTVKRKKKKTVQKKPTVSTHKTPTDPPNHYRLNLNEIPFVAGKAITPSHSLGANVQQVLSLMKKHNPSLCAAAKKNGVVRQTAASISSSAYTGSGSESELEELMVQLQDEFAQMSFEHQELLKQINEARDYRLREDLERELDHLVTRMEAKGDQIARLKKHHENLQEARLKKKKEKKKKSRPQSAPPSQYSVNGSNSGEVQVTTTIKTKGHGAGKIHAVPTAGTRAALNLLKDMRKLQTSLRKDDLSWE